MLGWGTAASETVGRDGAGAGECISWGVSRLSDQTPSEETTDGTSSSLAADRELNSLGADAFSFDLKHDKMASMKVDFLPPFATGALNSFNMP